MNKGPGTPSETKCIQNQFLLGLSHILFDITLFLPDLILLIKGHSIHHVAVLPKSLECLFLKEKGCLEGGQMFMLYNVKLRNAAWH